MSYWDTSALLKLYLEEKDSGLFLSLATNSIPSTTAFIGKHEARTAFHRKECEGGLKEGSATLLYEAFLRDLKRKRLGLVPESRELEDQFGQVLEFCMTASPPIFIRTNDALHLAAARVAGEIDFVSADIRQRFAAEALGFHVLPVQYDPKSS